MNFKDKTIVITGASSGIGYALAYEFASRGARIVMGARSEDKLRSIAEDLAARGTQAVYEPTDVTREEDCRRLVEKAVSSFGQIDVLICNAGISMRALFDEVDLGVLKRLMDVNFWVTVYCTKYAMTGFLETVRIENLKKGVHVMIAAPGFTASNVRFSALTADGSAQGESPRKEEKMMSAAEVARRIARGVVRRKRTLAMDFNGRATVLIKKFAPGLLDRLYYSHMAKEPDSPLK